MHSLLHTPHIDRSTLRRACTALLGTLLAALVAVGCGGGGGADGSSSDIASEDGPLSWLPQDTWIVASVNTSSKDIDTAIKTLSRLPAWTLAESALPADDGAGLRLALLDWFVTTGGYNSSVTAKQLEAALGDRGGLALTSTDLTGLGADKGPIVAWFEVDDEDKAIAAARKLIKADTKEREDDGVTWYDGSKDDVAFTVEDGLLVLTTSAKEMQHLIAVHDGDDSLADDETGRAVIEGGIGDAFVGIAIQTDPAFAAIPVALEAAAKDSEDPKDAAKLEAITKDLDDVLESDAVDELVPDWISTSLTIDTTGLRVRGGWSNPHELAQPEVGSRELVERMPADAATVSASVSNGDELERLQAAWSEVSKAYDLDLRELASECDPEFAWACDLGAEAAIAALEDEELAEAAKDAAPTTTAIVQDIGTSLQATMGMAQGAKPVAPKQRVLEVASSSAEQVEHHAPAELVKAAEAAGLIVTTSADQTKVTVRVKPGSPIAQTMQRAPEETAILLAAYGITPQQLLSPAGTTIEAEVVDDIVVAGLPNAAPSKVVPALKGDADTLDDSDDYRDVVAAAKPPKQVGAYGWLNVESYVDSILAVVAAGDPSTQRLVPTIKSNLSDMPGVVWWSAREDVDGEEIGVYELVLPVLE